MPAALLAGGALLAGAGVAGAQVPLPGAGGLPTGGVDSVTDAPAALCSGPLAMLSDLGGVCGVATQDQVQVGEAGQVVPRAATGAGEQDEHAVNIDLEGDQEPAPCDGPGQPDCEGDIDEQGPQGDCEECTSTTEGTTTSTTAPPSTETTMTTTPPTSVMSNTPPAEELPRTGSTVAPFVVGGAVLLLLGVGLVTATKRPALWRR